MLDPGWLELVPVSACDALVEVYKEMAEKEPKSPKLPPTAERSSCGCVMLAAEHKLAAITRSQGACIRRRAVQWLWSKRAWCGFLLLLPPKLCFFLGMLAGSESATKSVQNNNKSARDVLSGEGEANGGRHLFFLYYFLCYFLASTTR